MAPPPPPVGASIAPGAETTQVRMVAETVTLIVLASTLSSVNVIPIEGIALLLGVDRFMSEARAITNLIGNGVATLVISRSEGAFDDRMRERAVVELTEARRARDFVRRAVISGCGTYSRLTVG